MKTTLIAALTGAIMSLPMAASALTITTGGGAITEGIVSINPTSIFTMEIEGDAVDGAGSTWFGYTATEALGTIETNSLNPRGSFQGATVEWNSAADGSGISFGSISGAALANGDALLVNFAANETKYLIASWSNVAQDLSDFDLRVEATVVPVPAALGLLMTGLGGLALMRRRRKQVA